MYMIAEVSQYVAVASFTEAWIEMFYLLFRTQMLCRLLHGGVDWNLAIQNPFKINAVASFTEAWIEIVTASSSSESTLSPPSRRRGLKSALLLSDSVNCVSPPSRRRGLKSFGIPPPIMLSSVASFTEAWIEMSLCTKSSASFRSPPSRRRGLKLFLNLSLVLLCCRLLHGGVDWNIDYLSTWMLTVCRLLHGGVDWNSQATNLTL